MGDNGNAGVDGMPRRCVLLAGRGAVCNNTGSDYARRPFEDIKLYDASPDSD
jgi:hypothetical protein